MVGNTKQTSQEAKSRVSLASISSSQFPLWPLVHPFFLKSFLTSPVTNILTCLDRRVWNSLNLNSYPVLLLQCECQIVT